MTLVLILGGARSGKSRLAQELALAQRTPVTVVATATARDEEMADKIALHRRDRPADWLTAEEPFDLTGALRAIPTTHTVVLDCLTLWVSNLLDRGDPPEGALALAAEVATEVAGRDGLTIVISNEVGMGVVPGTPLGRVYRDLLGEVNQVWAALADRVVFAVAGLALPLLDGQQIGAGIQRDR
jgi:adenosyl cobinamide kinase/adenosyl cobinamide phosphate guanylyltransferase